MSDNSFLRWIECDGGPKGELIMVGGPAKAKALGKMGQVIKMYQDEATVMGRVNVKEKSEKKCIFEGWFSICIPETWEYSIEKDLLTIFSTKNAKGVIQISFFHRKELEESLKSTAENHLNRFLTQYNVLVDINTYKIIEAPNYTVAIASGEYEGEFIKVWTVVNEKKMLLVTYISPNKTRELSKADDIVYSISFDTSKP